MHKKKRDLVSCYDNFHGNSCQSHFNTSKKCRSGKPGDYKIFGAIFFFLFLAADHKKVNERLGLVPYLSFGCLSNVCKWEKCLFGIKTPT